MNMARFRYKLHHFEHFLRHPWDNIEGCLVTGLS